MIFLLFSASFFLLDKIKLAPFFKASSMNSLPSEFSPFKHIKNEDFFTFLESNVIFVIEAG